MNLFLLKREAEPEIDPGVGTDPAPVDPPETPDPTESAGAWPDDWRQKYAGEDEKKMAALSRYASPEAAFDGLIATKTKLSSGEYKSTAAYPAEGTEDEQNAWRELNGIPVKSDDYNFEDVKEEDKAYVELFQKHAFDNNIPADHANSLMKFLMDQEQNLDEEDKANDLKAQQDTEDKLRVEWGGDYRRNLNIISGLFDSAPEGVKDAVFGGRLADGTPFGSNPDVSRFLIDLALQVNPVATITNPTGGNIANSIEDEITAIEKTMGTPEYFKDEKAQARLRDLYTARDRMK